MKPIAVIFGANGFLGRYLCRYWARKGYEIVAVARRRDGWSGDGMFLPWDGKNAGPWELALEGASVVVNLAGRSVNCRYDEKIVRRFWNRVSIAQERSAKRFGNVPSRLRCGSMRARRRFTATRVMFLKTSGKGSRAADFR
jgi:nucleoside-diphosphate-sugar epimerase